MIDSETRIHATAAPARTDGEHLRSNGLLREGATGEAVRALQADLARLDYFGQDGRPLAVDGRLGPDTAHAVRMYQRDEGLDVDGIAGPKTLASIALQLEARTGDSPRAPVEALLDALHSGGDALREALARLQQSQVGQQWQRQMDDASDRATAQLQCAPEQTPEGGARGP